MVFIDLWNTNNVSGLEKRIARMLGIRNYKRRNLGAIITNANSVVYPSNGKFRFKILSANGLNILLTRP